MDHPSGLLEMFRPAAPMLPAATSTLQVVAPMLPVVAPMPPATAPWRGTLANNMLRLPLGVAKDILLRTLSADSDKFIEVIRKKLLDDYGLHNTPIKHLDWYPGLRFLNLFYIPIEEYHSMTKEVYHLLRHMVRSHTIGVVLHKTTLRICFAEWEVFPETISRLGKWLLELLNPYEWEEVFDMDHLKKYFVISFHVARDIKLIRNTNEYELEETSHATMHMTLSENPTVEPLKKPERWEFLKDLLCYLNNVSPYDIPEALRVARNYHMDGRIKEHCFPLINMSGSFLDQIDHYRRRVVVVQGCIHESLCLSNDAIPEDQALSPMQE